MGTLLHDSQRRVPRFGSTPNINIWRSNPPPWRSKKRTSTPNLGAAAATDGDNVSPTSCTSSQARSVPWPPEPTSALSAAPFGQAFPLPVDLTAASQLSLPLPLPFNAFRPPLPPVLSAAKAALVTFAAGVVVPNDVRSAACAGVQVGVGQPRARPKERVCPACLAWVGSRRGSFRTGIPIQRKLGLHESRERTCARVAPAPSSTK